MDISNSEQRLCNHPDCRKPLVQREGEADSKFSKRLHCDEECARTNPDRYEKVSATFTERRESETKVCEICKGDFHRRKGESKKVFGERPTCGKTCAAEKRRKETEEAAAREKKVCDVCGDEFTRHLHTETKAKFKKRKTCGKPSCSHTSRMRTLGVTERKSSGGMAKTVTKASVAGVPSLAPINPPSIDIPEEPPPPKPTEIKVWRPESWGGPKVVKVVNE